MNSNQNLATNSEIPTEDPDRCEILDDGPVTDSESKTVMLAAERSDLVEIEVIEQRFEAEIPAELEVLQRTDTYYGPKLFTHAELDNEDRNFLLTAPGPQSHLSLWIEDLNEAGKRNGWIELAEVAAELPVEQPPYERCAACGELIRSIHHERAALAGTCNR